MQQPSAAHYQHLPADSDPDEINLLEYLYALLKHKRLIIAAVLLGGIGGGIAAHVKGPSWVASAVIAPRELESQKTPSFAGLGALGGLVASQLNMGGNASLDKIDLVLGTKKFNAQMIEHHELLPLIASQQWPKEYKQYYREADKSWDTSEFKLPLLASVGGLLSSEYLKRELNNNNTMSLSVSSKDSLFSYRLMGAYLEYLNTFIKTNVQSEARENVTYLEGQLTGIVDPLLREKLQGLIATEMEKMMVVSKEAFQVIDPLYLSKSFKEKRLYPLVFAFGFGFLAILGVVFAHAFGSAQKSEQDGRLLAGIKRELFKL
jgi:LPS O-antigen subunit length determinant protein (WzzB/FepE family)